jgi:hypothetical protein
VTVPGEWVHSADAIGKALKSRLDSSPARALVNAGHDRSFDINLTAAQPTQAVVANQRTIPLSRRATCPHTATRVHHVMNGLVGIVSTCMDSRRLGFISGDDGATLLRAQR